MPNDERTPARYTNARMKLPALFSLLAALAHAAAPISIEHVAGQAAFTLDGEITDLSGLAWIGGAEFMAVSDKTNALLPVTLHIDPASGAIRSGEFGAAIPVAAGHWDFEGLAYVAATRTFYISTEFPPGILTYRRGAAAAKAMPLPRIFAQARENLSMESIAWDGTVRKFWTANEEALEPDGPLSDAKAGSVVRLLCLDPAFKPLAQYAWRTEPCTMRFGGGSGVCDLALLPNGTLLVLERGFGFGGLHLRIYAADFTDATNVADLPALDGAKFTLAKKTLLLDEATGFFNFEGLALGPTLSDGSHSLIVIADSHGVTRHTFLPLKIRFALRK